MSWITVTGNPFYGLTCWGPFATDDAARSWSDGNLDDEPFVWVIELEEVARHDEEPEE